MANFAENRADIMREIMTKAGDAGVFTKDITSLEEVEEDEWNDMLSSFNQQTINELQPIGVVFISHIQPNGRYHKNGTPVILHPHGYQILRTLFKN